MSMSTSVPRARVLHPVSQDPKSDDPFTTSEFEPSRNTQRNIFLTCSHLTSRKDVVLAFRIPYMSIGQIKGYRMIPFSFKCSQNLAFALIARKYWMYARLIVLVKLLPLLACSDFCQNSPLGRQGNPCASATLYLLPPWCQGYPSERVTQAFPYFSFPQVN